MATKFVTPEVTNTIHVATSVEHYTSVYNLVDMKEFGNIFKVNTVGQALTADEAFQQIWVSYPTANREGIQAQQQGADEPTSFLLAWTGGRDLQQIQLGERIWMDIQRRGQHRWSHQRGEPNTLGTLCYAPNHGVWWNTAHGSGQPDIGLQASPLPMSDHWDQRVESTGSHGSWSSNKCGAWQHVGCQQQRLGQQDGLRKRGETATPLAQQPKTTEMLMSATGSPTPESTDK